MDTQRNRLTLDLDPAFQRRVVAMAALKGISVRQYCQNAIDQELSRDEANGEHGRKFDLEAFERAAASRKELFGGKPLAGDSSDFIREAREIRESESNQWR